MFSLSRRRTQPLEELGKRRITRVERRRRALLPKPAVQLQTAFRPKRSSLSRKGNHNRRVGTDTEKRHLYIINNGILFARYI